MHALKLLSFTCALLAMPGVATAQAATDLTCTACVGTDDIAASAVTTNKIANGGVRNADLGANSVTSGKIKDGDIQFADLASSIQQYVNATIADVYLSFAYAEDEGLVGIACPADRLSMAPSCGCSSDGGTRNYGVLELCAAVGEGAIASCTHNAMTYDPMLPAPLAQVQATCIGGETNDGTPWVPTITGLESVSGHADGAAWIGGRQDSFEVTMSRLRVQRAEYENLLLKRPQ